MTQNTMESQKEITPANLDERMTNNIKDLSKEIYDILGMKRNCEDGLHCKSRWNSLLIEINFGPRNE